MDRNVRDLLLNVWMAARIEIYGYQNKLFVSVCNK